MFPCHLKANVPFAEFREIFFWGFRRKNICCQLFFLKELQSKRFSFCSVTQLFTLPCESWGGVEGWGGGSIDVTSDYVTVCWCFVHYFYISVNFVFFDLTHIDDKMSVAKRHLCTLMTQHSNKVFWDAGVCSLRSVHL